MYKSLVNYVYKYLYFHDTGCQFGRLSMQLLLLEWKMSYNCKAFAMTPNYEITLNAAFSVYGSIISKYTVKFQNLWYKYNSWSKHDVEYRFTAVAKLIRNTESTHCCCNVFIATLIYR